MSASSGSVEVIKFNERFCGKKVGPKVDKRSVQNESSETKEDNISNVKEFNIKRARYEVMRFGLSGFDKERQKKDKIAIAIRLGAKTT
ncbi:uncharacterized protein CEXT_106671 [Caerostris extrusa]|uniref:Uncharacterized protein n=1 Tax=Caerostris extrusa TaxID=172846 RepID=A0AAV4QKX9_CAEEX|nr:uncharacterized protein CEXT_106671 [Caerostris extrusa]